jgi:hypothetical protein
MLNFVVYGVVVFLDVGDTELTWWWLQPYNW